MARREFEQIVASGTKKGFRYLDLTQFVSLPQGEQLELLVFGETGSLGTMSSMYFRKNAITDTATGTHAFVVSEVNDVGGAGGFLSAEYPANKNISFQKFQFEIMEDATLIRPEDRNAIVSAVLSAQFDDETALAFYYENYSDTDIGNQKVNLRIKYMLEDTPKF